MDLNVLDIPFKQIQFKAAGDGAHTVEGYASVFNGQPDSYGDIVAKGAFVESLRQRTPKFLWQHRMDTPIGKVVDLAEDDHGLYGKWQLANTADAKNAYELMNDGLVEGLSIGFITKEADWSDAEPGVRILKRVDLFEISAVTIPANESALISVVKADLPFDLLLKRVGDGFALASREAQALAARRATDHRALNDRHTGAITTFTAEAEALLAELRALVTTEPEAKAPDALAALSLVERELELRRRRYHRPATSEVA